MQELGLEVVATRKNLQGSAISKCHLWPHCPLKLGGQALSDNQIQINGLGEKHTENRNKTENERGPQDHQNICAALRKLNETAAFNSWENMLQNKEN